MHLLLSSTQVFLSCLSLCLCSNKNKKRYARHIYIFTAVFILLYILDPSQQICIRLSFLSPQRFQLEPGQNLPGTHPRALWWLGTHTWKIVRQTNISNGFKTSQISEPYRRSFNRNLGRRLSPRTARKLKPWLHKQIRRENHPFKFIIGSRQHRLPHQSGHLYIVQVTN